MLNYLESVYRNSINEYNSRVNDATKKINPSLELIMCAFSKGCVCLNRLCAELAACNKADLSDSLRSFIEKLKHIIWLDSGHQGNVDVWLTEPSVIQSLLALKENQIYFYVYVTPYQISEEKYEKMSAIREFNKFLQILESSPKNFKYQCYFDRADLATHFSLLKVFDCSLIEN
jgi:hypothetical protein